MVDKVKLLFASEPSEAASLVLSAWYCLSRNTCTPNDTVQAAVIAQSAEAPRKTIPPIRPSAIRLPPYVMITIVDRTMLRSGLACQPVLAAQPKWAGSSIGFASASRSYHSEVGDWLLSADATDSLAASQRSCSAIHINAAASVGNLRMDRRPLVETMSTTKAANPSRTSL